VRAWWNYSKQKSVAAELKTQDEAEQQRAQKSLVKTISTLQLLAKQGLPCFTISG